MKIIQHISALLLCSFTASPVFAQEDACDAFNSIDQLEGNYSITNGPGQTINVPGLGIIPGPATATSTATLTKYGDSGLLGLDSEVFGDLVVDLVVLGAQDETWNFQASETFESASSEDISVVMGCDNSEKLMRLFGTGVTQLPNVGERPVTMYLTVFPNGLIVGRMDVVMLAPDMTLQTRIHMDKTE